MNLQAHIENLRAKPEHIRKRYAFWSSFGVTAVIFAFWLSSFTTTSIAAKQSAVAAAVEKAGSPGQSMVASVGALGKDIWQLIFGSKKVEYAEVEALPGK